MSPNYSPSDLRLGASINGTTVSQDDSPAGPLTMPLPAPTVVSAFANCALSSKAMAAFGMNHLGHTENNDSHGDQDGQRPGTREGPGLVIRHSPLPRPSVNALVPSGSEG